VDHLRVADGHHAEGDVLRAHVVRALNLVDLVGLGHHHAVMLQHHCVGVDTSLECQVISMLFYISSNDLSLLTTLCVLQSCPAMVRSKRKASELMTSMLQVSERPKA